MEAERGSPRALILGRYRVYDEIAAGGMATVHLGRLIGDEGFLRTVAIKRLHPWHARIAEVVAMFTDEARIAARIRHPNVVGTLDVVSQEGEVFLVMEYVHGEPLSRLISAASKRKQKIPPRIVAAVLSNALRGLHAAHEAKDARGEPLGVVHRDVSPQNVLVGADGVSRVLDFGIARAAGRAHVTSDHTIKGKLAYMSPEQLRGEVLDRRADVYAAGVVLWETLTCRRLYAGASEDLALVRLLEAEVEAPSKRVADLPTCFDEVTLRALRRDADARYATALEMAMALEACGPLATPSEIGAWVEEMAGEMLAERARLIQAIESEERRTSLPPLAKEPAKLVPSREEVTLLDTPVPPAPVAAVTAVSVANTESQNAAPANTPERRVTPVVLGLVGLVGILVVALIVVLLRGSPESAASAQGAPSMAASLTAPESVVPSAPSATPTPAPSATSVVSAAPTLSPSVTAPPRSTTTRVKTAAPRDGCDPPFFIDASGRKKYKRHCL
ncbi:serine/threonine protein kinase [Polyangium jinanense]|uniref:Protein kinase n=1 Tax=Polyangium jinanense TaxID=2829994 RepID=A0A9X3X7Z2_9BACT|nr:serine/threonine protein kinase [Polyangium jinanense]MDC3956169.1 protein kinase [Polyangium jinanense]MDC3982996.1 protein kinase [Polyangium jinanense]